LKANGKLNTDSMSDSTAKTLGGAMYMEDSNVVSNVGFYGGSKAVDGAGIYIKDGELLLVKCSITSNTASGSGGGIYCVGGKVSSDTAYVSGNKGNNLTCKNNCSFVDNANQCSCTNCPEE